ncbi:hybrid sensor histidine kinase/response regulator [Methylobacterium iners]|nr:PAS domain-containing protein [Methylobacterium iners]
MAAQACDAPMAHVNFIDTDRQWIKAAVGHDAREMPLHFGFCTQALAEDGILVLPNLKQVPELASNILVAGPPHLRFYAGVPLLTPDGWAIGTLCVLDREPRTLTAQQEFILEALARTVMAQLESRRSAAALRAREAELRLVADAMPVLIGLIDRSFTYRFANAAYQTWMGRAPESVVGHTLSEVLGEDEFEARRPQMKRALAGEEVRIEMNWACPNGQVRIADIRYMPRFAADGSVDGFYVFVHDVSDRKRVEDLLQTRASRLEAQVAFQTRDRDRIWTLSPVLKVVAAPDGRIESVNPSWTRALGWSEGQTVGQAFLSFVAPEDQDALSDILSRLAATQPVDDTELSFVTRDGSTRRILWTIVPEDGLLYGFGRDITEQRQAEEALRQSQKLEAIGQLTGGVAHDFNNLLTIIRSSVEFLRRPDLAEERRRRYLSAVSDTVDRAAKLTSQLLAFARRQALQPEVFEVSERLRTISDMLDSVTGARIQVITDLPREHCYVRSDASQFETALVNIAVNARDAMDGEGKLTLRLDAGAPMPPIRGHAGAPGPFVAVSVTDTGTGIPQTDLARIFEPFFTTKEVGKGTGLGLSQVIGFAKQSGGDVGVSSTEGEGTVFTLYLPQVKPAVEETVAGSDDVVAGEDAGLRVLVVEDNLEVGRFCTQILEDLGHHPIWAENAEAALARLQEGAEHFDAVFSDVVMPGIGGIELARQLRASHPNLPMVLTSGYSHVLAQDDGHGFDLLRKPYSAEELARMLRRAVTGSGQRRGSVPI